MSVHIEGFEDFDEELQDLQERADELDGRSEIPMDQLFTESFMQSYTPFSSLAAFFDDSPWTVETKEDFKSIPEDEFDRYVDEHTGFDDWETMLQAAGREWVTRQLDLE
jgi:hypothetical protein